MSDQRRVVVSVGGIEINPDGEILAGTKSCGSLRELMTSLKAAKDTVAQLQASEAALRLEVARLKDVQGVMLKQDSDAYKVVCKERDSLKDKLFKSEVDRDGNAHRNELAEALCAELRLKIDNLHGLLDHSKVTIADLNSQITRLEEAEEIVVPCDPPLRVMATDEGGWASYVQLPDSLQKRIEDLEQFVFGHIKIQPSKEKARGS